VERKYVLRTPARLTSYRVDYDRELNDEQREVVLEGTGPILVIAGAGSGKTRTLVYRVSRLIESGHDPSRILLLTFTNRAAREMLRRVESLLAVDMRRLMGGTFHSVGNRLLRRFGGRLGLGQNFTILDPEDAREMLEAATSDKKIPTLERRFPKGDVLLDLYSYTINTGRPFTEVLAEHAPHFSEMEAEIVSVFQRYRERKRLGNACDYDDLLLMWKRLLDEVPEAAAQLHGVLRPHPRGRVPGHQPAPGGHRGRDGAGQEERHGRRRRRAGDLLLPRRLVREHPRVPEALPGGEDLPPDAQLPLDARDPGAGQRLDRAQREASSPRSSRPRATSGRSARGRGAAGHRRPGALCGAAPARVARRGGEAPGAGRSSTAPTTRRSSSRSSSPAAGSRTRSARARASSSSATSRTCSRSCASSSIRRTSCPGSGRSRSFRASANARRPRSGRRSARARIRWRRFARSTARPSGAAATRR
jgi:hypothetical protein